MFKLGAVEHGLQQLLAESRGHMEGRKGDGDRTGVSGKKPNPISSALLLMQQSIQSNLQASDYIITIAYIYP